MSSPGTGPQIPQWLDPRVVTEDGVTLEAELRLPAGSSGDLRSIAVLSHPHPLYGGDMHNPLIADLFAALPAAGVAALRYNFRGVGRSGGTHDEGRAERFDAAAAFETAAVALETAAVACTSITEPEAAPLVATKVVSVGWSFGADVSLAATHPALTAWIAIAAPLKIGATATTVKPSATTTDTPPANPPTTTPPANSPTTTTPANPPTTTTPANPPTDLLLAATDRRPKLLLVPEHDQFCTPEQARLRSLNWPATTLEVIANGDHFLGGRSQQVADRIMAFVKTLT